jgi:hypothetical protein
VSRAALTNFALVNMVEKKLGPRRRNEAKRTRSTSFSAECPLNQIKVVSPYPRVIRSKTYRGRVKPRIILNAVYNVKFV